MGSRSASLPFFSLNFFLTAACPRGLCYLCTWRQVRSCRRACILFPSGSHNSCVYSGSSSGSWRVRARSCPHSSTEQRLNAVFEKVKSFWTQLQYCIMFYRHSVQTPANPNELALSLYTLPESLSTLHEGLNTYTYIKSFWLKLNSSDWTAEENQFV